MHAPWLSTLSTALLLTAANATAQLGSNEIQLLQTHANGLNDNPQLLTALGNTVFWSGLTGSGAGLYYHRRGLGGPVQVTLPGGGRLAPKTMAAFRDRMYVGRASRGEIYGVDRNGARSTVTEELDMGGEAREMVVAGNHLLFSAPFAGRRMWICNGNTARPILSSNPGIGFSPTNPERLTSVGNRVYFVADHFTGSGTARALYQLTVTDFRNLSLKRITDRHGPSDLTVAGNDVYFKASITGQGSSTAELCRVKTDPAVPAGQAFDVIHVDSAPTQLTAMGSKLFYTATGNGRGRELYAVERGVGRRLIRDINPSTRASNPAGLTVVDDRLFFFASRTAGSTIDGREPWVYDPNTDVARVARNIRAGSLDGVPTANDTKAHGTVHGQPLFLFQARRLYGEDRELWISDGTWNGTRQLTNNGFGGRDFKPVEIFSVPGQIYVVATPEQDSRRQLFTFEDWRVRGLGTGSHWTVYSDCANRNGNPTLRVVRPTAAGYTPARPIPGEPMDLLLDGGARDQLTLMLASPNLAPTALRMPVLGSLCPLMLDPSTLLAQGFDILDGIRPMRVQISDGSMRGVRVHYQALLLDLPSNQATVSTTYAVEWGR